MTQPTPPLLGYNNNVHHQGRTFHIQTEDSGTKYARIITHLFIDGGRIVKSTRTQYPELLGTVDRAEVVRRMMKEQHKSMFLSLRAGEFDEAIQRIVGEEVSTEPPLPSSVDIEPMSERLDPLQAASFIAPREAVSTVSSVPVDARNNPAEVRPSGRPSKARQSVPAVPRRSRVVDDPTPIEFLPPTVAANTGRPSERQQKIPQPLPSTAHPDVVDPRSQSIFGDTGEGRQTLDEVILSFLEEEES